MFASTTTTFDLELNVPLSVAELRADALERERQAIAPAPAAPAILVTTAHPSLHEHTGPAGEAVHPRLGRLIQPRHTSSIEATANAGILWAADNDGFNGIDERRFTAMLDRITGLPGCVFVTVPDALRCGWCEELMEGCECEAGLAGDELKAARKRPRIGDVVETGRRFDQWAPDLERRGLPLALVAQDGLTLDELEERAPRLAALFIGGSDAFKLGPDALELARRARDLGLWVHWGRVNTRRRFDYIVAGGAADSFDGSSFARFRKSPVGPKGAKVGRLDRALSWCWDAHVALEAAPVAA